MATARVENGMLFVELPWNSEGKTSASRKSTRYATTEDGNGGLVIEVDGKPIKIQVNAWGDRVRKA